MTITTTLRNLTGEAAESVDMYPYLASSWVETNVASSAGFSEYTTKIAGVDLGLDLVRRRVIRSAKLWHPDTPTVRWDGMNRSIHIHTNHHIVDDVSGLIVNHPVEAYVGLKTVGGGIDDQADMLYFMRSVFAEWYYSVTTGLPDTVNMAKLSLGAVRW